MSTYTCVKGNIRGTGRATKKAQHPTRPGIEVSRREVDDRAEVMTPHTAENPSVKKIFLWMTESGVAFAGVFRCEK